MAASLLAMVCGITARSKKHEMAKPLLLQHRDALRTLVEDLVRLATEDAAAYDSVLAAMRERKARPGPASEKEVQTALKHAAETPMSTAAKCLKILETAVIVARLGTKSASSDVGVAVLLAEAGFEGAVMNVRINLKYVSDPAFSAHTEAKIKPQEERVKEAASRALAVLGRG